MLFILLNEIKQIDINFYKNAFLFDDLMSDFSKL